MGLSPTDTTLGAWAPSTSPLRIEYTTAVMEEVRARAVEGFYKLPRGGVEVAGILVGEHESDQVRILQQIPFEIEYAYGPGFMLSPRDLAFLRKLLDETREQVASIGRKVLGLYVSHSRGELSLKEVELGLYAEMFPHDWQTILLLKPSRAPETPAAFFVREPNGQVRANRSHLEFELVPEMGERRPSPEARRVPTRDESLRALASASARTESPAVPASRDLGKDMRVPPALLRPPGEVPAEAALADQPPSASRRDASGHEAAARDADAVADAVPSHEQQDTSGSSRQPQEPSEVRAAQSPGDSQPAMRSDSSLAAKPIVADSGEASAAASSRPAPTAAPDVPSSIPPSATALPIAHPQPAANPEATRSAPPSVEAPGGVAVPWEDEAAATPRRGFALRWLAPVAVLVLVAALGYLIYEALNATPPTVVFFLQENGDRAEVVWQLKGIRDASAAEITIETDGQRKTIDLMRSGQMSGSLSDPLLTAKSLVILNVTRRSAPDIQRVAPLLGSESPVASLRDDVEAPTAVYRPDDEPSTAGTADEDSAVSADPSMGVAGLGSEPQGNPDAELVAAQEETARILAETERVARLSAEARAAIAAMAPPSDASPAKPTASAAAVPPPSSLAPTTASGRESSRPGAQDSAGAGSLSSTASGTSQPDPVAAGSGDQASAPGTARAQASRTVPPVLSGQAGPGAPVGSAASAPKPVTQGPAASQQGSRETAPSTAALPGTTAPKPVVPAKARAGRLIWTGQLRKNQTLQIMGADANRGTVTAALPGSPVRLNVLPGELTAKGLVVYTANPRYRNAADVVEPPGPTNGWNETRFQYDPVRANSLIVTAIPNQTNRWEAITVRNDDKTINVIVIDWLADTQ